MAVCPVFRVAPEFPGPKQSGPGAERHGEWSFSGNEWMDLCLGCRLCDVACPSGVNVYELNLLKRIGNKGRHGRFLREWLLSHTYLFGALGSLFSRLVNPLLEHPLLTRTLDVLLGIDRRNKLPFYAPRTFVRWFSTQRFRSKVKVAYFYGCQTNTNEPEVGKAVVEVFQKLGIETILPYQSCCGLPKLGVCNMNGARRAGLRTTGTLLKTVRSGIDVIFSSTSCGLMIKHDYSRLLSIPGADEVARHMYDFFEYLNRLCLSGRLNLQLKPFPMKIAYFTPCHLKSLSIGLPALDVLKMIPQLEVHNLTTNCCGLGGAYGFKKEKAGISGAIGEDLAEEIRELGPDLVVSDCEGCRMRIRQLTGLKVVHPSQILAQVLE
jgi:glycerol-3-phosphate dehydrogenase subunit C